MQTNLHVPEEEGKKPEKLYLFSLPWEPARRLMQRFTVGKLAAGETASLQPPLTGQSSSENEAENRCFLCPVPMMSFHLHHTLKQFVHHVSSCPDDVKQTVCQL